MLVTSSSAALIDHPSLPVHPLYSVSDIRLGSLADVHDSGATLISSGLPRLVRKVVTVVVILLERSRDDLSRCRKVLVLGVREVLRFSIVLKSVILHSDLAQAYIIDVAAIAISL